MRSSSCASIAARVPRDLPPGHLSKSRQITADKIADYLNWYEATQFGTRTNAFDSYLKAAKEVSREETHRFEPITRYLDLIEKEY